MLGRKDNSLRFLITHYAIPFLQGYKLQLKLRWSNVEDPKVDLKCIYNRLNKIMFILFGHRNVNFKTKLWILLYDVPLRCIRIFKLILLFIFLLPLLFKIEKEEGKNDTWGCIKEKLYSSTYCRIFGICRLAGRKYFLNPRSFPVLFCCL